MTRAVARWFPAACVAGVTLAVAAWLPWKPPIESSRAAFAEGERAAGRDATLAADPEVAVPDVGTRSPLVSDPASAEHVEPEGHEADDEASEDAGPSPTSVRPAFAASTTSGALIG